MSVSTVVSLFPFEINESKPGVYPSRFLISKAIGNIPQVLQVPDGHTYYFDIDSKAIKIPILSETLAQSIVYDFVSSFISYAPDAGPAVFWVEGAKTAKEVQLQHKDLLDFHGNKQVEWFRRICRLADDDWARYGVHKAISDLQRFAADSLGLDRPWARKIEQSQMATCPACRQIIPSDALICHLCRTIVKPEEFKAAGYKQVGNAG